MTDLPCKHGNNEHTCEICFPPTYKTINQRVAEAQAAYNSLSPVEKALADSDQRRSFVEGQTGRSPPPDVLADEVRRLRLAVAQSGFAIRSGKDRRIFQTHTTKLLWLSCNNTDKRRTSTKRRWNIKLAPRIEVILLALRKP